MKIEYFKEYSHCLNRDMEFKVYGHGGKPILVFPAQNGRFYDFENFNNLIPLGTFEKEEAKWKNIPGFNINQIEEFLDVRIPFVDSEIEKLKTDKYEEVYEKFSIYGNKLTKIFQYHY